MPEQLLAAAYIRVSTDDQIELSPDSQVKEIRKYAKAHNMILVNKHIYRDEGISGRTTKKRPGFNNMIAAAKTKPKPFDVILVWKFSRFARNQEESIVYKSLLRKNGVDVTSISEPIFDSPFGSLIERIIEWMDEYYSIRLSGEVQRGMKEKVERGGAVSIPAFGYDIEKGNYIPNDNADTVRSIFADFNSGMGYRAIATKYSDMGIRSRRGNPLDNRAVSYILNNPVYIGKVRWSPEGKAASKRDFNNPSIIIADGTHEPLITEEVFNVTKERIQQIKNRYPKYQRPEQNVDFMLKGLVRCSDCGSTLVHASTKEPSIQCHNYAKGLCKVSHNISIKKINAAVIAALQQAYISGDIDIAVHSPESPTVDYQKKLDKEYRKLERIKLAFYEGTDTVQEYAENKAIVLKSIEDLKAKVNDNKKSEINTNEFASRIKDVLEVIKGDYPESYKNQSIRTIVEKIVLYKPDNRIELFFYL